MKIESADFIKSATKKEHYLREGLPEIAFVGKSNVGKSSLINRLVNRKGLVKTSSTPGKTQQVNFFKINNKIIFVDLPGYGYAKVPASVKRTWGNMIESYLKDREELKLVISLVDIRRDPGEDYLQLMEWFHHFNIPFLTVITKTDKAKKKEIGERRERIASLLGLDPEALILCSATTGLGKKELWREISSCIPR